MPPEARDVPHITKRVLPEAFFVLPVEDVAHVEGRRNWKIPGSCDSKYKSYEIHGTMNGTNQTGRRQLVYVVSSPGLSIP